MDTNMEAGIYRTESMTEKIIACSRFHDLYHRVIFLQGRELALRYRFGAHEARAVSESEGLLVYGYIGTEGRMQFQTLCLAERRGAAIIPQASSNRTDLVLDMDERLEQVTFRPVNPYLTDLSSFASVIGGINLCYAPEDAVTEEMRGLYFLDDARDRIRPDRVRVLIDVPGKGREERLAVCRGYSTRGVRVQICRGAGSRSGSCLSEDSRGEDSRREGSRSTDKRGEASVIPVWRRGRFVLQGQTEELAG